MRRGLARVLSLCCFCSAAVFAEPIADVYGAAAPVVLEEPAGPAPQLVHLEQTLTRKQNDRDKGALSPEAYQVFVSSFRAELDAVIARVPTEPENAGLHALILARLGDRRQAQANLEQALADNPENPALLVSRGGVLYEQKDYPAAAEAARRAWESSGRTDKRAWALLKMSERRSAGQRSGVSAPALRPAADFARLEWTIPDNNDIDPRALGLVRRAIAARRKGDMAATLSAAQAAMNADPASTAVQKLYGLVRADQARQAETSAFIKQAVESLQAGKGTEAVAWASKAYDRSPSDETYGILQDVRTRGAALGAVRINPPQEPIPTPKRSSPLLPLAGAAGLGIAAYGVCRSKSSYESKDGFDEDHRPACGPGQRFVAGAVLAGLGGAAVYLVGGAALGFAPVAMNRAAVAGNHGMRLMASEAGAISPRAQAMILRAGTLLNGDRAVIDSRKLVEYSLSAASPTGRHKARVFQSALGFTHEHADEVVRQVRTAIATAPATPGLIDMYGIRMTVDVVLKGPAGQAVVRTGWIYDPGSMTPRMTTIFVK